MFKTGYMYIIIGLPKRAFNHLIIIAPTDIILIDKCRQLAFGTVYKKLIKLVKTLYEQKNHRVCS